MSYLELCPVCQRAAKELVDCALDFTAAVTNREFPRICAAHLTLIFSTLSYRTMAAWLDQMIVQGGVALDAEGVCPLCIVEKQITITAGEKTSEFLCPAHGGTSPVTVASIRRNLARIAGGERFDHQNFVIRAALIFYASIRGTVPMVRVE